MLPRVPPHSPALLYSRWQAAATLQSLRSAGPSARRRATPARGEGEAGGPEGREAGTSAILAGERTTVHRVPSLPPARSPGSPLASTAGSREVGDRGGSGGGSPRDPRRRTPLGGQHAGSLNTGPPRAVRRSRRHGDACPSNRDEWLWPARRAGCMWGELWQPPTRAPPGRPDALMSRTPPSRASSRAHR